MTITPIMRMHYPHSVYTTGKVIFQAGLHANKYRERSLHCMYVREINVIMKTFHVGVNTADLENTVSSVETGQ